jgi:myo-inositol-1(or 4)-monophosphatase
MINRDLRVLSTAVSAAIEAGRHFSARLHFDKVVRSKSSPGDLVTEYDAACEESIRKWIDDAFPTHTILGEETTEPGSAAARVAAEQVQAAEHLWIVDPIDGTTNFVHQLPLSVVSIGYAESGVPKTGVIFDPYRDEVFVGERGLGAVVATSREAEAWAKAPTPELPGRCLVVSPARELRGSVVATGFPSRSTVPVETTQVALSLSRKVKSLRAFGAAALHMAYVAAGRLDGYFEYDLNAWDLAAGALLVAEAGGTVKSLGGTAYSLLTRDVVAAGQIDLANRLIAEFQAFVPQTGEKE